MTFYQSYFNGSKIVQRQVKRKAAIVTQPSQTGAGVVELKKVKEQDKKAVRLKMAQEVMRNL